MRKPHIKFWLGKWTLFNDREDSTGWPWPIAREDSVRDLSKQLRAREVTNTAIDAAEAVETAVLDGGRVKRVPDVDGHYSKSIHRDDIPSLYDPVAVQRLHRSWER